MIHFLGESHAARILRRAAMQKGLKLVPIEKAQVVFVSEDTPTDEHGNRDLNPITCLVAQAGTHGATVVITSQVPVGYCRPYMVPVYHQAETLRIKDAEERAYNPEQLIVGCRHPDQPIPDPYMRYLLAFNCPIHAVTYEEAEFSKIAINLTLISQVENTNRLHEYAKNHKLSWDKIKTILQHDKRIGPMSYLDPGDWRASRHLLRDYVTFNETR